MQKGSETKVCSHLGTLSKQALAQLKTLNLSQHCDSHKQNQTYYLCLHCGTTICLQLDELSCSQRHLKAYPQHCFMIDVEQGGIYCNMCQDTIQNLIFAHPNSEEPALLKMKRFEAFVMQVWNEISPAVSKSTKKWWHRGLTNLGNTCFMNVVLQALNATQPLKMLYESFDPQQKQLVLKERLIEKQLEWFYDDMLQKDRENSWNVVTNKRNRQADHIRLYGGTLKTPTLNLLIHRFMQEMSQKDQGSYSPSEILQSLGGFNTKYRQGQEQDADELLLMIIDLLNEGERLKLLRDKERYGQVERVLGYQKLSPTQHIFGFYLLSHLQCGQCGLITCTLNLSYSLPIESNTAKNGHSEETSSHTGKIPVDYHNELLYPDQPQEVNSFLSNYFSPQRLSKQKNYYNCHKCKALYGHKTQYIVNPPKVLIISLKRFNAKLEKNNSCTAFPEELGLKGITLQDKAPNYRLYCVIVHEGRTMRSGHYIVYLRHQQQWIVCSDEKVHGVTWSHVQKQQAYILLYEMKDSGSQ